MSGIPAPWFTSNVSLCKTDSFVCWGFEDVDRWRVDGALNGSASVDNVAHCPHDIGCSPAIQPCISVSFIISTMLKIVLVRLHESARVCAAHPCRSSADVQALNWVVLADTANVEINGKQEAPCIVFMGPFTSIAGTCGRLLLQCQRLQMPTVARC